MRKTYKKLLKLCIWGTGLGIVFIALVIFGGYLYYAPQLPSVVSLKDIHLQTPLRIYSDDGKLIAEFGEKRRTPVNFNQIPNQLIHAFMAAEDADFYTNNGIDINSLIRAAWELVSTGHIQTGGSTITMQVAKNFFLSPERVFSRKFKEILLALRINKELSKQDIMELYLNKIYLGNRAYGVQAAAHVYYGTSIKGLDLAQMAMIAGLPKAPSAYNPLANPTRAIQRRNWILSRMLKLGYISQSAYDHAIAQPVTATYHALSIQLHAPYIAEMVRQEMINDYGANAYTNGLKVYTTINSTDQKAAQTALINGLETYDRRHGYRGPSKKLTNNPNTWQKALDETGTIANLVPAVVTQVNDQSVQILLKKNQTGIIPWKGMSWARPRITLDWMGNLPKTASDVLSTGDFIWVKPNPRADTDQQLSTTQQQTYSLAQLPEAQGALVSLNPEDGAIQALVGGFDFYQSHFNRALQASRQVGSAIKPFIYSAALANGMTAATMINDAPIVMDNSQTEEDWRPHNDDSTFNGPMSLRQALYQSRNLVSIRILQQTGINKTLKYVENIGLPASKLPDYLSLALGSADLTPLQLATGYAVLANGGYKVKPYFIQKITSSKGMVFEASPLHVCNKASIQQQAPVDNDNETHPAIQFDQPLVAQENCAKEVMSPQVNYIINSIMRDVITKGTGRRALTLKRHDLAGKTGTTNKHKDAWFAGFNPKLLTVVWVGKDNSTTLGRWEFGSTSALPIWINYMRTALRGKPETELPQPPGIVTVRIDKNTGQYADPSDPNSYFEVFRKQYAPSPNNQSAYNKSNGVPFQPGDIY